MNKKIKNPGNWLGRIHQYGDRTIDDAFLSAWRAIARTRDLQQTSLLDVGCGCGSLTRSFADSTEHTAGVAGCDISTESIAFCRKMNPAITYFVQDALEPLPEDHSYDVIVFTTALAQFDPDQQHRVLTNARNRLTPGGYLLILDVNSERTAPLYARFKTAPDCEVVLNKNLSKRFFGRTPAMILADRMPFPLLELLEKIVPGDMLLRLMLVRISR